MLIMKKYSAYPVAFNFPRRPCAVLLRWYCCCQRFPPPSPSTFLFPASSRVRDTSHLPHNDAETSPPYGGDEGGGLLLLLLLHLLIRCTCNLDAIMVRAKSNKRQNRAQSRHQLTLLFCQQMLMRPGESERDGEDEGEDKEGGG